MDTCEMCNDGGPNQLQNAENQTVLICNGCLFEAISDYQLKIKLQTEEAKNHEGGAYHE